MRVLLLSLMESVLFILQCCFWLFDVWKHLPQLSEYWAEKNNEDEMLDVFSVVQTIPEQLFVLRLLNIAFFKQQCKIVASLPNFHIWFWMIQEMTSCTNFSNTESIARLQDRSVVWLFTVYCDWYNMPSVNNENSRSPEVNLFWKIYLHLIANFLLI